jgi:hypothetical protein
MNMAKQELIDALYRFVNARSGISFRDYGEVAAYRSDQRKIVQAGNDARVLLRQVELSGITAEEIIAKLTSGRRLSLSDGRLDYCVGQCGWMEYRPAVAGLCASLLWDANREAFARQKKGGESDGGAIRRKFRALFGRGLAKRYFS